jgi:predicted transcriptional regulator
MGITMTQSKLEVHLQILKTVTQNSPAKENVIASQSNIALYTAKQSLTFLSSQGLLCCNQKGSYQVTCRGYAVLKHFRLLDEQQGIVEELNC